MTHHQNSSLVNVARDKVVSARLRSDKTESCIDAVVQEKQALALKLAEIQEKVVRLECELCLLYTSPSPRDQRGSRMPSSA